MIVIRDPKTLSFDFDFHKDVDENLKHKVEFIIKNDIEQLLSKYNHGNNIHEHGKQQNECTTYICS